MWCTKITKPQGSWAYLIWSSYSGICVAQASNKVGNAPNIVMHDLYGGQYNE